MSISYQFPFSVSMRAGQTARAEALAAEGKSFTVYMDARYRQGPFLVWDWVMGEESPSRADPTRLGLGSFLRIAQLQCCLHQLTASARMVQVTHPKLHHFASHCLYVRIVTLQLLYLLLSATAGSEVAPFWWAMTWLQPFIPVSSLH